jgi:hypothetical protein
MSHEERGVIGTTWRSYVAEAPAWGIVAGALAVSFWTQVDEVQRHGFAVWEALIWGSSTDAGTIACLFLAREGAHRGTPTWGAWVLSIACAALSVQFNVVAGVQRADWLSVEAHVWMPALALGVWYWLLHGRHRRWLRGQAAAAADGDGTGAADTALSRPAQRTTNLDARVLRLVRANPSTTWRAVMGRTGLSEANAKRALTAAHKKLLADAQEAFGPSPASPNGRERLNVVSTSAIGEPEAARSVPHDPPPRAAVARR